MFYVAHFNPLATTNLKISPERLGRKSYVKNWGKYIWKLYLLPFVQSRLEGYWWQKHEDGGDGWMDGGEGFTNQDCLGHVPTKSTTGKLTKKQIGKAKTIIFF